MVLTHTARFRFEATKDVCRKVPDPNVLVCKRLLMMPIEIVVRDYLAGTSSTSILQMYKWGSREMYGHRLPEGLRDNQKLPETIITLTTKAEQGDHDAPLSGEEILARNEALRDRRVARGTSEPSERPVRQRLPSGNADEKRLIRAFLLITHYGNRGLLALRAKARVFAAKCQFTCAAAEYYCNSVFGIPASNRALAGSV